MLKCKFSQLIRLLLGLIFKALLFRSVYNHSRESQISVSKSSLLFLFSWYSYFGTFLLMLSLGKEKYWSTYNTNIGIKKGNSYRKNEDISGWKEQHMET